MTTYYTGDTIRLVGTFRDWAEEEGTGTLIDPDTVTVYITSTNGTEVLAEAAATQESTGVYYYDWETPTTSGTYVVRFKGTVSGAPIIAREKIVTVFY